MHRRKGLMSDRLLVLTIADPDKTAPVYDEMAVKIRSRFKAQNLSLRTSLRVQGET